MSNTANTLNRLFKPMYGSALSGMVPPGVNVLRKGLSICGCPFFTYAFHDIDKFVTLALGRGDSTWLNRLMNHYQQAQDYENLRIMRICNWNDYLRINRSGAVFSVVKSPLAQILYGTQSKD